MKYTYAYKSSDGQRHEATLDADSREAVFASLRRQGIKPIKVMAADGSKANGEVRGIRKRVFFLSAVCLVLCAIVVGIVAYQGGRRAVTSTDTTPAGRLSQPTATPRHQIYGDPVIVEAIEHGKTDQWLTNRLDQMLAWFVQPGKFCCPKETNLRDAVDAFASASLLPCDYTFPPTDPREVRELKQMINGMHAEMKDYLANGNGTRRSYWRRLQERTREESLIYARTKRELERETNPAIWERKNEALRNLGLRTIPNPRESE